MKLTQDVKGENNDADISTLNCWLFSKDFGFVLEN